LWRKWGNHPQPQSGNLEPVPRLSDRVSLALGTMQLGVSGVEGARDF